MHERLNDQPGADRELQRAALRDLTALLAECAKSEADIEKHHVDALADEKRKFDQDLADVERRVGARRAQVMSKYNARVAEITSKFESERQTLEKAIQSSTVRFEYEKEGVEHDAKKKLEHATWLAESVYDGTIAKLKADFTKAQEQAEADNEWVEQTRQRVAELLAKYGYTPIPVRADEKEADGATDEASTADLPDFATTREQVEGGIASIASLTLPKLFVGVTPYIIVILVVIVAGVLAQWMSDSAEPNWMMIGMVVGGAVVLMIVLGFILRLAGQKAIAARYIPVREALDSSRQAIDARLKLAADERDEKSIRALTARDNETRTAKERLVPHLQKAAEKLKTAVAAARAEQSQKSKLIVQERDQLTAKAEASKAKHLPEIEQLQKSEGDVAHQQHDDRAKAIEESYATDCRVLEQRWAEGLKEIQAPIRTAGQSAPDWTSTDWKSWIPPKEFPAAIRFGQLTVDPKLIASRVLPEGGKLGLPLPETFTLPSLLAFPRQSSILIEHDHSGRGRAIETVQMLMSRILTSFPPGRVRFTIFDPQGLGQNFAGFMHLADYDENLVGKRIWTNAEHIEQRLADLTEHMETVIQKYLRNEFETIDDYNAQAGELAEPYRFLVIADFPVAFQGEAFRRLASIASTGARCGVYTLVARDTRQQLPSGAHMDELRAHSVHLLQQGERFVWNDEVFKQFSLSLDPPPPEEALTQILHVVGKGAKEAARIEVSFDAIAPRAESEYWGESSADELRVPIGRLGATRNQMLKLGRGVAQHALIAGKTGSGKSTLMHAIITNLAMWYSPAEVEFYLIDFKKGVEFKTYATNELPHARAIAVESDREFGLSVLQRIDAELARRGELYRKAGVQDLSSYRQSDGAKVMPRVLLIIDEFQEFFSEDDRVAQEAGVLIDRLVRQGRAFGIHLLLGSQTIGGTSGLARSTLGQMAVRIALQLSEADSQLILGDNNSAARLLGRPGEAIYNDAGGLVEGNSPFQVAWLPDDRRDQYLERVSTLAKNQNLRGEPAIVFEGNAPANIAKNVRLAAVIEAPTWPADMTAPRTWMGEPVAIKDPTAVMFRRQSGSNLLIVGQHEEAALAVMSSALVSLAAQRKRDAATVYLFDGTPADSQLFGALGKVAKSLPLDVKNVDYRDVATAMGELAEELERRQASETPSPRDIYVFVYGVQRYRALRRQEESFSFASSSGDEEGAKKLPNPDKVFSDLLREGPALGMHVIAWADTAVSVDRTLERGSLREFDNRILFQMSAADSSNLIDSPMANKLGMFRAIYYSEEQGVTEKFRPYALPNQSWLADVNRRLTARSGS